MPRRAADRVQQPLAYRSQAGKRRTAEDIIPGELKAVASRRWAGRILNTCCPWPCAAKKRQGPSRFQCWSALADPLLLDGPRLVVLLRPVSESQETNSKKGKREEGPRSVPALLLLLANTREEELPMGERRGTPRKPATKFAHLRKKMEKNRTPTGQVNKERQSPRHAGR
jgi:hypothetical protein